MRTLKCTHCEEEAMTAKEFITERCRWCGGDLEEDRRGDDGEKSINNATMNEDNQDHIEEEAAAETKQQEQDRLDQQEAYEDTMEYYRHIQA